MTRLARRKLTAEDILRTIFIVLFAQIVLVLLISLFTCIPMDFMAVITPPHHVHGDYRDLYLATWAWLHGINPYLASSRFVTPPPSLLATLPFQWLSVNAGAFFFFLTNIAVIAAAVWKLCGVYHLTSRERLLFYGVVAIYYPALYLIADGNLDGLMLGLVVIAIFAQNSILRAVALGLSISLKVYSTLLLVVLAAARKWKQAALSLGALVLAMAPFWFLFAGYIGSEHARTAKVFTEQNISPFAMVADIVLSKRIAVHLPYAVFPAAYLMVWLASYGYMLYRSRNASLTTRMLYSLAWTLAMPLQVFPHTGLMLLPLLALKIREIGDRGSTTLPDRLFLTGFCMVGFQQEAFGNYLMLWVPRIERVCQALDPMGTVLVIASLMLAAPGAAPRGSERLSDAAAATPVAL